MEVAKSYLESISDSLQKTVGVGSLLKKKQCNTMLKTTNTEQIRSLIEIECTNL
jgi:hypothetical protein